MSDLSVHPPNLGRPPPLWRLATPVLLEQLLSTGIGLVDTWLTCQFLEGDDYLAAMNQVKYLLWLLPSLFALPSIGATALVARHVGAGDLATARRVVHQALLIGAATCVLAMIAGYAFLGPLLSVVRLHGSAADLASQFVWIVLPVMPLVMIEQVGTACLRGAGDTVTGLVAMTIVNVVDALVGAALVLGWGPFPKLGWQGIALGTAAGYAVGGLLIGGALVWRRAGLHLHFASFRPSADLLRRIVRVGLPGAADILAVVFCQFWFVSLVNRLGDSAAGAHGLAIQIEALAYLPGTAFQVSAATLAGQWLGARDPRRAMRSVLSAWLWSEVLMGCTALWFLFGAEGLVRLFMPDGREHMIALAAPLLRTIAIGLPALAGLQVFTGALRGAGESRWPLAITFFGFLVVRMPLAYWLTTPTTETILGIAGAGQGVQGAWYAMVIDLCVRCVLIAGLFFRGGWTKREV